ncbi:Hypothetical predicted protein [Olea europaea subsp. europaea]|uniref:Uncharacterized protein n=1 Tax=Olea europaea subsp. europaea TaxID=158383 RepID=A0A8S0V2J9_OLEEU|nr:Hypothetical predicted protein [Olea europaea subsp. europaea]
MCAACQCSGLAEGRGFLWPVECGVRADDGPAGCGGEQRSQRQKQKLEEGPRQIRGGLTLLTGLCHCGEGSDGGVTVARESPRRGI